VEVPSEGGDTFYASLHKGWVELDAGLWARVRDRRPSNTTLRRFVRSAPTFPIGQRKSGSPWCTRWCVATQRRGELGLYVSEHAKAVEGLAPQSGRALVEELIEFCTAPGRTYQHRWQVGGVLIWDNRSMLHRAQGFDQRHRRVMDHVRVAGTEAVLGMIA
jgi:alpha-ketoglutarate-dependent taurine dioxygenase